MTSWVAIPCDINLLTSPPFRGSPESFLFFGTRSVSVDQAFPLFAEHGLKGATAPCAVHGLVFGPPGIPAVEIAEFHAATIASFFFLYSFHPIVSTDFLLLF
jgi:hypothetical protein